jgi:pimeloyl-ACP methyl ester carboxylesterase
MLSLVIALASVTAFYFLVSALIANGMAMSNRVPVTQTPSRFGVSYQSVSFHSRDDKVLIRGWYITGGNNGTIIVMHGGKQCRNDETIDLLQLCCNLGKKGFNVLTIDRRGCGLSEVAKLRSRARFDRDFGGAFDFIRNHNGVNERIFLLGISVGAVAAIVFASRQKNISGTIADSCFASNYKMSSRVMGLKFPLFKIFTPGSIFTGRLITGLIRDNAIDRVKNVSCPILFINGDNDLAVPLDDARLLCSASNNKLDDSWIVEDAGHSWAYRTRREEYIARITTFITNNCLA